MKKQPLHPTIEAEMHYRTSSRPKKKRRLEAPNKKVLKRGAEDRRQ